MLLVDTSVVIDFTRTADAQLLEQFQEHDAAICGVTRAEVLHGSRDPAHTVRLIAALDCFRQVAVPDDLWDVIGKISASCDRAVSRFPLPTPSSPLWRFIWALNCGPGIASSH